jgi:hypothetical protein
VLDAVCAAKRITIPALTRLGTRLADYRVLAFPYEGGIKYRDMETGRRWSATDSVFSRLKIIRAGAQPSDTFGRDRAGGSVRMGRCPANEHPSSPVHLIGRYGAALNSRA